MSYIVPRDKPIACRHCGFMDRITYDCKLLGYKDYPDFATQYASCPLVEVPTPHGRLMKEGKKMDVYDAIERAERLLDKDDVSYLSNLLPDEAEAIRICIEAAKQVAGV